MKFSFIDDTYEYWDMFDILLDFLFGVDIILNFFSCYFDDDDNLIQDLCVIAKAYIKLWFWIDLMSILPMQFIFSNGNLRIFLRASKLPKLYKISKISKLMRTVRASRREDTIWNRLYNTIKLNPGIDRLFINLFSIFIFCHIISCLWHFFAQFEGGTENWISKVGLEDAPGTERYLTSLYWIVQTVITVGYGDIPISNSAERIIAIFAMFSGVIFFSLTIGSLSSLITDMDRRGTLYEKKTNTLLEIKKQYAISDKLFNKIQSVIKFRIYRSDEKYTDFLEGLKEPLQSELGYIIYKPIVKGIAFFDDKDKLFLTKVAGALKKINFSKGEIIYAEGEYANEMFFIKSGIVSYIMPECKGLPFMSVKKGKLFGEIDMIFEQTRKFTAVAHTDVEVLSLENDFYKSFILRNYKGLASEIRKKTLSKRMLQIQLHEAARQGYQKLLHESPIAVSISIKARFQ